MRARATIWLRGLFALVMGLFSVCARGQSPADPGGSPGRARVGVRAHEAPVQKSTPAGGARKKSPPSRSEKIVRVQHETAERCPDIAEVVVRASRLPGAGETPAPQFRRPPTAADLPGRPDRVTQVPPG